MKESTEPRVTIMIPTYKQAHCITTAVKSALAQDYPNLEILVSDDCSPDNTQDVLQTYVSDVRFRYIKNPINIGRVRNYKKVLENYATGDWVVNLDGDDYYTDSHFISEMINLIYSHTDIVMAQGGRIKRTPKDESLSLPKIDTPIAILDGKTYLLQFANKRFFSHMTTLYKREIALKLNFYSLNIESADMESMLRLVLHGNVLLVKKPYGIWNEHQGNFSGSAKAFTKLKNLKYVDSVYQYALTQGLSNKELKTWKKNLVNTHLIGWWISIQKAGRVAQKDRVKFLRYAFFCHPSIFLDLNFFKITLKSLLNKL